MSHPWGHRPTRLRHRMSPSTLVTWRGANPLLCRGVPHAGHGGQDVGPRARSASTASTTWTERTRATCHAARISAVSERASSTARRRRCTDGSSSRMLSLRHSIGKRPPLEPLARNSKSVPDFRCYASPPPTEICALAAIEFGGCCLRVFINSQGYGALRYGQLDPVSDTEFLGAGHELLHSTLYLGPRMVGEVLILLGDLGLKRRQFRVPGVPDFLGPHRIPPQHVADALIREHLGQLLIEEVQLQGPLLQQFFNLGFRNGRNVMEPLLREVFDVLAFEHAPVADKGDLVDAT